MSCEKMEEREPSIDTEGRLGVRGVRGVTGMGGDTGVDSVGEMSSEGTGFLRELLRGRGGVFSERIPNSDMGRDRREARVKLLMGSSVLNVGIVGDGGDSPLYTSVLLVLPAVLLRRGGGNDGTG